MTLKTGGFRSPNESRTLRSHIILSVVAIVVGAVGLLITLYLLAARLFDNVPYSAFEVMLPVGIGIVSCVVLQGVAMWRMMK